MLVFQQFYIGKNEMKGTILFYLFQDPVAFLLLLYSGLFFIFRILENPTGSKVGKQDPCSQIGSPVGNQVCIVSRLLRGLLLLKLPHPELRQQMLTAYL